MGAASPSTRHVPRPTVPGGPVAAADAPVAEAAVVATVAVLAAAVAVPAGAPEAAVAVTAIETPVTVDGR